MHIRDALIFAPSKTTIYLLLPFIMQKTEGESQYPRVIIDFQRQHLSPAETEDVNTAISKNNGTVYFSPKTGLRSDPPQDWIKTYNRLMSLPPINFPQNGKTDEKITDEQTVIYPRKQ